MRGCPSLFPTASEEPSIMVCYERCQRNARDVPMHSLGSYVRFTDIQRPWKRMGAPCLIYLST